MYNLQCYGTDIFPINVHLVAWLVMFCQILASLKVAYPRTSLGEAVSIARQLVPSLQSWLHRLSLMRSGNVRSVCSSKRNLRSLLVLLTSRMQSRSALELFVASRKSSNILPMGLNQGPTSLWRRVATW